MCDLNGEAMNHSLRARFFSVNPLALLPAAFLSAAFALSLPGQLRAEAPNFVSGNGITVSQSAFYGGSKRTIVVNISTPLISKKAITGGENMVWITLPASYFTKPSKRYPVLYLLHGAGNCWSGFWYTVSGKVESYTADLDLIIVMPEGGHVGMYTDWVNQWAGAQKWETFHIKSLIPWIDSNLRTNPGKKGRAIAGFSMGGFGALHYGFRHPDMFSFVGSMSGNADIQHPLAELTKNMSILYGFPPNGAFGPDIGKNWTAHNPVKNAAKFRGVTLALYAGSGVSDLDILERTLSQATGKMHKALNANGIPNTLWMYGRPGGSTGCDGGHNMGCWNMALKDMLPKMMKELSGGAILQLSAPAADFTSQKGSPAAEESGAARTAGKSVLPKLKLLNN